jgi:hypothetical protein
VEHESQQVRTRIKKIRGNFPQIEVGTGKNYIGRKVFPLQEEMYKFHIKKPFLASECATFPLKLSFLFRRCVYFFGGLDCVGLPFTYVAYFIFLRDVWILSRSHKL